MKTTAKTHSLIVAVLAGVSFISPSLLHAQTVVGGNGANATDSTVYSGSQSITKIGSNTVTLSGDNSYTGLTTVDQGRLVLGAGSGDYQHNASDFAINNASILSFGGVRFDLNNQTTGTVRTITFDAGGGNTFDTGTGVNLVDWRGSTYRSTGGARNFITGSSGLNINGGVTATLDVARGTDATTDLLVSTRFWNGGSLLKTGDGIATLTGTNSYSGTTTISAGTLQIGNGGTSGTLGAGAVTNNATLVFNRSDNPIVGNAISGTGEVIKTGAGNLRFSADNSYTGLTTVNQGRLILDAGSGVYLNNASDFLINNESTLAFSGFRFDLNNQTTGTARTITFGAGGGNTFDTGAGVNIVDWHGNTYRTTGGARNFITGSSGLNINTVPITLEVARGTDATTDLLISSRIYNAGSLVKTGDGIATLTGDNTYTGGTLVNAGTLILAGGSAVEGGSTATGPYTIGAGATLRVTAARFWFNGTPTFNFTADGGGTIDTATGVDFITGGNTTITTAGGARNQIIGSSGINLYVRTTTLNVARGTDATTDLLVSSRIYNAGSLVKTGDGIATLTGDNTYTGTTTVGAGTLAINGNNSGATGAVTVQSGATLAGSGTVGGATTIQSGATHAPGNSPGLQTFNSGLTYATGSTFQWELIGNTVDDRGLSFDGVDVSGGTLSIGTGVTSSLVFNTSGSSVSWADSFWASDRSWLVFANTNSPTLDSESLFDTIDLSTDSLGATLASVRTDASFAWNQQGNDVYLTYTAVPEPSTYALLILAAAGLAAHTWRQRRRRSGN